MSKTTRQHDGITITTITTPGTPATLTAITTPGTPTDPALLAMPPLPTLPTITTPAATEPTLPERLIAHGYTPPTTADIDARQAAEREKEAEKQAAIKARHDGQKLLDKAKRERLNAERLEIERMESDWKARRADMIDKAIKSVKYRRNGERIDVKKRPSKYRRNIARLDGKTITYSPRPYEASGDKAANALWDVVCRLVAYFAKETNAKMGSRESLKNDLQATMAKWEQNVTNDENEAIIDAHDLIQTAARALIEYHACALWIEPLHNLYISTGTKPDYTILYDVQRALLATEADIDSTTRPRVYKTGSASMRRVLGDLGRPLNEIVTLATLARWTHESHDVQWLYVPCIIGGYGRYTVTSCYHYIQRSVEAYIGSLARNRGRKKIVAAWRYTEAPCYIVHPDGTRKEYTPARKRTFAHDIAYPLGEIDFTDALQSSRTYARATATFDAYAPDTALLDTICSMLTPRQADVVQGIYRGETTGEIAARLKITPSAVSHIRSAITEKLDTPENRALAATLTETPRGELVL